MKIEVKNLAYRYALQSHDVLRGINLTIDEGSYWCLLGPNGSGKTTLLKLFAGLLPVTGRVSGEIVLKGKPLSHWLTHKHHREFARELAFVPGAVATDLPITVEEFVAQGRFAHSSPWALSTSKDQEIVRSALSRVRLDAMADVPFRYLSSGERQLILMARALAQEPRVLLIDETTSNLDLHYQLTVFKVLEELNRAGTTIVIICHDLNLASEFCPNAMWLRHGEIVKKGVLAETFTTETLRTVYPNDTLHVGRNPLTDKPKVFIGPRS